MFVNERVVELKQIPTMVIVRRELSKARRQYFTFLSEEGCGYLKDYLELRMREGEEIDPDSAIITPKQKMKPFVRATNVGYATRESIRCAGFKMETFCAEARMRVPKMVKNGIYSFFRVTLPGGLAFATLH